ncbi:MAG: TRAP transporter large permease [Burkholderiales bacterium]|nr:TRAP transporter large permease [Burkholderiales bacterium]
MLIASIVGIFLLILGFPLWLAFLAISIIAATFSSVDISPAMISARLYSGLNLNALLAIPGFLFAAEVMTCSGMSKRLVRWVASLVGRVPGGMALTTIAACEMFGAVSASSMATVAAVGKPLYPGLRENGYGEAFSLGLITSMGAIALLIPPSIIMIIYAAIAHVSVEKLFLAGILPGIMIGFLVTVYSVVYALRTGATSGNEPLRITTILKATKDALWTLFAPIIIFGGIYGGFFTPTEASMVLSIYSVVAAMYIYRNMDPQGVWKVIRDSTLLTAKIFVIIGAASALSLVFVLENVPNHLAGIVVSLDIGPYATLLIINIVLFAAGIVVEPIPAMMVLIPLFLPMLGAIGIDPIHFGIIVMVNLAIAMFTPPLGLNLFMSAGIFNVSVIKIMRGCLPFVAVYVVALILISYIPIISLWLPSLWE